MDVLFPAALAAAALVGLLLRERALGKERAARLAGWREAARKAELTDVVATRATLAGASGSLFVRFRAYSDSSAHGTRITVSGEGLPPYLTVRPEGLGRVLAKGDERTLVEGLFTGAIDVMIQGSFSVGGVLRSWWRNFRFSGRATRIYRKQSHKLSFPTRTAKQFPRGPGLSMASMPITAYRGVLTKNKPINTLADIKGLKIRVPQNPMLMNTFKAMGANPTVVNYGELYTALQTGVVEGCELTAELVVGAKLQETSKYFSFTNHIAYPLYFGIHEKSWQKAGKYQADLVRAATEAMSLWRSQNQDNDNRYIQVLKESGVKVTDPGDAERQKFREAAQTGAWKEFFEKYPDTKAIADKILALQ